MNNFYICFGNNEDPLSENKVDIQGLRQAYEEQ